jgi:hypothetical protein
VLGRGRSTRGDQQGHNQQEEIKNHRPSSPRRAARGDPCHQGAACRPCRHRPASRCHHAVLLEGILAIRRQQAILTMPSRICWPSSPHNAARGGPRLRGGRPSSWCCRGPVGRIQRIMHKEIVRPGATGLCT